MMKNLLPFICLLASCSAPTADDSPAALAAQTFYRHLVAGEYEQFLQGKSDADSVPALYREQLLTGYRQFMAQQQEQHGGIREVRIASWRKDSLDAYTQVFLVLGYADSTSEEIVVPMVDTAKGWKMK